MLRTNQGIMAHNDEIVPGAELYLRGGRRWYLLVRVIRWTRNRRVLIRDAYGKQYTIHPRRLVLAGNVME